MLHGEGISTGTPFNCNEHPFSEDILRVPQEHKDFFDHLFAGKGDIFYGFLFDWAVMKELILKEIYECVKKLIFVVLDVPDDAVLKVAHMVAAVEKMGSKSGGFIR